MPTPTVTGFEAEKNLGNNRKGLNSRNNSTSSVVIQGTNLTETGMTVNVTNGAGITWSGGLFLGASIWRANLQCTNNSNGEGETEDVTVTVGTENDSSPGYNTRVDVAPV